MIGFRRMSHPTKRAVKAGVLLLALAALSACSNTERFGSGAPEPAVAPPALAATAPAAPPQPPPVDLAGRWKFAAAGGAACMMTLDDTPGADQGKIAPAGGCPGNFFTSRKWTYEHDMLIIHDYKGQVLAELSFSGGHFEGKATSGGAVTLARP